MASDAPLAAVRRSWLERVLGVVRELGSTTDLHDVLQLITSAVVDVLEFGAAAINVVSVDGTVRVDAVAGPPGLDSLIGVASPLSTWHKLLDSAQVWGELRFVSNLDDQSLLDHIPAWTPEPAGETTAGGWHPLDVLLAPLRDTDGELLGVLSVDQPASGRFPDLEQRTVLELFAAQAAKALAEATARHAAESARLDVERKWQLAFAHSPMGAALFDGDGALLQCNDAMATMFGYERRELATMSYLDVHQPEDVHRIRSVLHDLRSGRRDVYESEERYLHADGHTVWATLHVAAIRDERGRLTCLLAQLNDVTGRKVAEASLSHRDTHDLLTDLPNRVLIGEAIQTMLTGHRAAGILFCDLDRFKTVNDSLGHDAGDELLDALACRLRGVLEPDIVLGRVGGDEFVAIVPDPPDTSAVVRIGERMMASLDRPLRVRGHEHTVTMSIGATMTAPWHEHRDEVLREANQALLRAKRQGRARLEVYDPVQDRPASVEDLRLERALRDALDEGSGLLPFFQPVMDLALDRTVGYESLIRWQHPERGLLEPWEFLPLAEQTGLIVPLGWWMLEASTRIAVSVADAHWVAVNISGAQLGRGQLGKAVRSALSKSSLPPRCLHLEITETALVEASPAAVKEIRELAELGVTIALDDFGTGYSSLTLLRDLPVSAVKIDRTFIAPIRTDRRSADIVRNLVALCRDLQMSAIAEGVETQEQLDLVRKLGCTHAQGYIIGTPSPLGRTVRVTR